MKQKTLTLIIFLATLIAITVPLALLTSGASEDSFESNVTITNTAPSIVWVNNSVQWGPSAGTTRTFWINFNVTDNNSVSDIDASSIVMNISMTGETTRSKVACRGLQNSSDSRTEEFECNITISYWDRDGSWTISVAVADDTPAWDTDSGSTFTMDSTDDIDVLNTTMLLTGTAGEQNVGPGHIILNNTGNQNYTGIAVNATYLTSGSQTIGASNYSVNVSASGGPGEVLQPDLYVGINDSILTRGEGSQEELYFYLDIPSGLEDDTYDSERDWLIDGTGAS